jgi:hypothetical protein
MNESNSTSAQYVTLQLKNWLMMVKGQNMSVWLSKMVLAQHFLTVLFAVRLLKRKAQ